MDFCDCCEIEITERQAARFDGFCHKCYDNAKWFGGDEKRAEAATEGEES